MDANLPVRIAAGASRYLLARWSPSILMMLLSAIVLAGCITHRGQSISDLPHDHIIRAERLVIHSDVELDKNSPLIKELAALKFDILSTLNLIESRRPVVVYLFKDQERYAQFMRSRFPKLPMRRAFFVGTTSELAVYAYQSDQLATDLRHEYTHGVLHSVLRHVPLWLDEGLAEYFEPPTSHNHVNEEHVARLITAIQGGWQPDLHRLETLTDVNEMQAMDYHEAWAWVYTLLNADNGDQKRLIEYVQSCKTSPPTGRLTEQLGGSLADARRRLTDRISKLETGSRYVSEVLPAGFEQFDRPGKISVD